MVKYTGPERRESNYNSGRRETDQHCAQHEILWYHHDEDKNNSRALVCGKIKSVKEELSDLDKTVKEIARSTTPWKVFALSMTILILLFGWLGKEIKDSNSEIKESINAIHRRISTNDQEVSSETKILKDSINQVNISILSIDSRLKNVEKSIEAKK